MPSRREWGSGQEPEPEVRHRPVVARSQRRRSVLLPPVFLTLALPSANGPPVLLLEEVAARRACPCALARGPPSQPPSPRPRHHDLQFAALILAIFSPC